MTYRSQQILLEPVKPIKTFLRRGFDSFLQSTTFFLLLYNLCLEAVHALFPLYPIKLLVLSAPTILLEVAKALIRLWTAAGVLRPSSAIRYAAKPAMCGVAMLVPLMVFVAVVRPIQELRILTPAAKISTMLP